MFWTVSKHLFPAAIESRVNFFRRALVAAKQGQENNFFGRERPKIGYASEDTDTVTEVVD